MRKFAAAVLSVMIFLCGCDVINVFRKDAESGLTTIEMPEGELKIHFIDVGQGDCIFIQTNDENMMIDAGNSENGADIAAYLHNLGVDKLDDFIGTHPHADHLGGGAYIVREFAPENIYMTQRFSSAFFFEKLLNAIDEMGLSVEYPKIGVVYNKGDLKVEFLAPDKEFSNTNDNSIVTRIEFGKTSALFTGDAETAAEYEILSENVNLSADVLKVGHHGSSASSSQDFIDEVAPKIAVIQCGKGNSYGHPHTETLQKLKKCGAKVYRCDELGTIVLKSDGEKFVYEEPKENDVKTRKAANKNYIGNINSKVFHLPSCKNLPSKKNSIYFSKRSEALEKGYKACGNCRP